MALGDEPPFPPDPVGAAIWASGRAFDGEIPETAVKEGVAYTTGAHVAFAAEDPTLVPIGDGSFALPRLVRIERWSDTDGPSAVLVIDSTSGAPTVEELRVRRPSGTALRRLGMEQLVELGAAVYTRSEDGVLGLAQTDTALTFSMGVPDGVRAVRRARRLRADDETLALTAKAWTSTTGGARIEAVKAALGGISERHARRYVKRAQTAGLLERERAPRKTKTED